MVCFITGIIYLALWDSQGTPEQAAALVEERVRRGIDHAEQWSIPRLTMHYGYKTR